MRKEAGLEQWKELYELALKIKELKPWEYLWDMDLITLILPEHKEPFYCSIMGKGAECYAIATYAGFDAIQDFYEMAGSKDMPPEQLIRYQNAIICYFGNRDELMKNELQLIKDLGLKFRGKNQWVYFHSFKPGYAPYMLDEEEVLMLILVYKQLYMAICALIERGLQVDFEHGYTLARRFDEKQKLWLTHEAPILVPPKNYSFPRITDDLLMERLKKQKATKAEIEIDTLYLNAVIRDKEFERPVLPVFFLLADRKSEMIISQDMITPEDNLAQIVLGATVRYIEMNGKPKKIYVRDKSLASLLHDLCERLNISLEIKENLRAIDTFASEFARRGL